VGENAIDVKTVTEVERGEVGESRNESENLVDCWIFGFDSESGSKTVGDGEKLLGDEGERVVVFIIHGQMFEYKFPTLIRQISSPPPFHIQRMNYASNTLLKWTHSNTLLTVGYFFEKLTHYLRRERIMLTF
jgi:hypothetical protein